MNVRCSDPTIWTQVPGRPDSTRRCHAARCSDAVLLAPLHRREHLLLDRDRAGLDHLGVLREDQQTRSVDGGAVGLPPHPAVQVGAGRDARVDATRDRRRRAAEGVAERTDALVIDPSAEKAGVVVEASELIEREPEVVGLGVDDRAALADVLVVRTLRDGERSGDRGLPEPMAPAVGEDRVGIISWSWASATTMYPWLASSSSIAA